MKKISPTIQPLVIFTLIFIAVGLFAGLLWNEIEMKSNRIDAITQQIADETVKQSHFEALKGVMANTAAERARLDSLILPDDQFVPFVESVEKIGKTAGVVMTDSLNTADNPNTQIQSEFLVVQIGMTGSWSAITRAVSLIESLPYAISVDHLILNKDLSNAHSSVWQAAMTIQVVKYK